MPERGRENRNRDQNENRADPVRGHRHREDPDRHQQHSTDRREVRERGFGLRDRHGRERHAAEGERHAQRLGEGVGDDQCRSMVRRRCPAHCPGNRTGGAVHHREQDAHEEIPGDVEPPHPGKRREEPAECPPCSRAERPFVARSDRCARIHCAANERERPPSERRERQCHQSARDEQPGARGLHDWSVAVTTYLWRTVPLGWHEKMVRVLSGVWFRIHVAVGLTIFDPSTM